MIFTSMNITGSLRRPPNLTRVIQRRQQGRWQEMKWGGVFFVKKSGKWKVFFCKKKVKNGGVIL